MMPVTDRAQILDDDPHSGMRHQPRPALRPIGAGETALIVVLAVALGLATAVLLPPDLVPAGGTAQDTEQGR
jgi:hypothetical protein